VSNYSRLVVVQILLLLFLLPLSDVLEPPADLQTARDQTSLSLSLSLTQNIAATHTDFGEEINAVLFYLLLLLSHIPAAESGQDIDFLRHS
jgi:hypothetical protein